MSKKSPAKKSGIDDAVAAAEKAAAAAEAAALLSPRGERLRVWAKRADDAVVAMQEVQQLLQQHSAEVDSAKQSLEQLTLTASPLWALDVEELPAQYRDKSRPASQRVGSAASARGGGSAADQRSSSKQGQRAGSTAASNPPEGSGAGVVAGNEAVGAAETVESAIRQLSPAQRSKVSAALQALFYAPASVTPTMSPTASPTGPATVTDGVKTSFSTATIAASPQQPPVSGSGGAESDPAVLSENGRKASVIPLPLLNAMRELQSARILLEAQLAVASAATAQQLRRFQILQDETMVTRYALEALRGDAAQPA